VNKSFVGFFRRSPSAGRGSLAVHRGVLVRIPRAAWVAIAVAGLLLAAGDDSSAKGKDHRNHRVIAALGDSITAGYPGYNDPDPARRQLGLGDNPKSQWEYWAQREHPKLRVRNCGVSGERTDEIARRLGSCIQGADGVVIQGGTNDLILGIPVDVAAANLRSMVRAAKNLNLDVALADVLPYNRYRRFDPQIEALNDRIHSIAAEEGVTLLPFHDTLEDPAEPDLIKAGWVDADLVHPSVAGHRRLGEQAFRLPARSRPAKSSAAK
jgi:lysophospholipase L1-like esterase